MFFQYHRFFINPNHFKFYHLIIINIKYLKLNVIFMQYYPFFINPINFIFYYSIFLLILFLYLNLILN